MENESRIVENEKPLQISPSTIAYLKETGSWAMFFAILGFVFIIILVLGGFFIGAILSALNGEAVLPGGEIIIGVIYLVIGIIYFFPIYFLYQFSSNMKKALQDNNSENLDLAFKNFKSHFKFVGIMTIIILALYILAAIAMVTLGGMF